jgi:signal transduction histidine kinase
LGLSIVDTLVSGHGGSVDFDTSPTAGTTVTVRIPAHP